MARRKHKGGKRREEKAQKRHHPTSSLEDDLKQQRLRQQQRLQEQCDQPEPDDTESVFQEFFPTDYPPRPLHLPVVGRGDELLRIRFTSSASEFVPLYSITRQSPTISLARRNRLNHWMASRFQLEHLSLDDKALKLFGRSTRWTSNHTLPDGMQCAHDIACKSYLEPSSRTFDVASISPDSSSGEELSLSDETLPTIATTLQGGFGIYRPPYNAGGTAGVLTMRSPRVYSIRIHQKSRRVGALVRTPRTSADPYAFHLYPLPHASTCLQVAIPSRVNDFCFGSDLVIFAGTRHAPLFLPLNHVHGMFGMADSVSLRSLNITNFPKSDVLRVEMSCRQNNHSHSPGEKVLAFGHRNGQVSLLDLRQSHSCVSILSASSGSNHGSATNLKFLNNRPHLLVERSFGVSQLHDIRKISTTLPDEMIIHTFEVPEANLETKDGNPTMDNGKMLHKTLTHNCNGICVDPLTEETLISPYIDQNREPRLGVWNLTTGDWVGTKSLLPRAPGVSSTTRVDETYYAELCTATTPAYKTRPKTSTGYRKDKDHFGAWLKCGEITSNPIPIRKYGSLQHVTMPGRWDEPN